MYVSRVLILSDNTLNRLCNVCNYSSPITDLKVYRTIAEKYIYKT